MTTIATPTPLTDLRRRVTVARNLIREVLTELVGPVELAFDFHREWNGCWRVRVDITAPVQGRLDFTLLDTATGGMLALPRPLPERWRLEMGIVATDGTRWTLDDEGHLVPFRGGVSAVGPSG
ncbi:hypothetical protein CKO25_11575 [Thiocapsa imhoffii]|uniref:Uncharacterized protein n=1 Tax=Thiocapsa imhoffii TaxID=382777 RepID=A0A9X0WIC7_9GAMM|nr:hypothetical protein [Thiocapsa imhoffii]MBK1645269.1 hypothetical protein [Thiocapsa imhoffii]